QQARRRRLAPARRGQPRRPAALLGGQHRRLRARPPGEPLLRQPAGGAAAGAPEERSPPPSRQVGWGVSTLRANRMKPSGSASRKKARSSTVRSAPVQPKMTALGGVIVLHAPLPLGGE